jgi:TetR/AcrR family transcriptional regulator
MSTEEKIRRTALVLFLERGFERTSIREIARKAKINIALMNYYFRSKENLFDSIFSGLLDKYTPILFNILNSPLPLEEKIKLYVEEYIDILQENPKLTYFVLSVLHRNPDKITKMKIFQSLYHTGNFTIQFKEELRKGNIKKDVDPTQFFINMLSLITFPFTVKQVIMEKQKMTDTEFRKFMDDRKQMVTEMLIQSIK